MRKLKFVILLSTCIGLGLTAWSMQSGELKTDLLRSQNEAKLLQSPAGRFENRKAIGSSTRSKLELKTRGSFRFGADHQTSKALIDQRVESRFQGLWEEIVIADDGLIQRSLLIPTEMVIDLKINGEEAKAISDQMLIDLARGFVVLRERNGLVRDVIMSPGSQDFSSDYAYALAKSMQFAFPEGELKSEWTSMEEDQNGEYQARYHLLQSDDNHLEISREKILYSKLHTSIEGNMTGNSLSSETRGELRIRYNLKDQSVMAVEGEEALLTLDENQQRLGENQQTISWTILDRSELDPARFAAIMALTQEKFVTNVTYNQMKDEAAERQVRNMYEARLGNDNLETILRAFQNIETMTDAERAKKEETEWFLKARALVYLHPEELPRIQDLLGSADVTSSFFQTMTAALVNISSPEAQKVLAHLALAKRDDAKALQSLVPDLGFVQNPEVVVEEALRTLQKDEDEWTRSMADLALSTLGSQLDKSSNPEKNERLRTIVNEVHAGFEAAEGESLKHKLDMLGNLATPDSLPLIKESLKHADSEIRALSATALRDLKSLDAENLLKDLLTHDKDAEVRVSAAMALQNFKPNSDLLNFESAALEKEENVRVRIQLLIALAKARYVDGHRVKSILEHRSKNDTHEQARNYADLLLTEFTSH